jgi:predicted ATPase/DNA-binding SARP family transcriptional activator
LGELRFRVLGSTDLLVDDEPVSLPGAAERALLVLLLLSPGRIVPATTLIDRLWSEAALPADPVNALQIRVSKLRRALRDINPDLITRERTGYRINVDPHLIDAEAFVTGLRQARTAAADGDYTLEDLQSYDDALALWRGQALADFPEQHWALAEAARLTELRLAALSERAQVALALGRHAEVVADLEPVVANDPTLESLAGQLMTALYRSGRQADALDVYTRTRTVLDENLGLEPSTSLRSLHERVLRQDPSLGGDGDSALLTPAPVMAPTRQRGDSASRAPGALTLTTMPLIGRDDQLASLAAMLTDQRLVSLVGPGGAGKTTLALAAAAAAAQDFTHGAVGVRLAPVSNPDQVPVAFADALGVPLDGGAADRNIQDRLTRFLTGRHLLLLVDNCEHVVDAAASVVEDILARCPDVTVITTSREALAVPAELQVLVGPLEVPPEHAGPEQVLTYPASQLFAERARMVRPGLLLDAQDAQAVGRITRALDGLPLAIELAAARVASLSPTEIAQRLDHRFALLTGGSRTAETRQQTLRATVDWSYALLEPRERAVFDGLSVFRGGWTLAAAEAVLSEPGMAYGAVLDTLGRLVERSLVVVDPGRTTRYRMLETLREYATEQLTARGEHDTLARRHADYYARFAQDAEMELRGHGQRDALARLRAEQPNVRAALEWLSAPGRDLDTALTMAGALGLFWHLGRHLEGREALARLLAAGTGSTDATARALQAVSIVERPRACLVHPSPRCAETAEQSLTLFEDLGDPSRAALSRVLLAVEGVTGAHPDRSEQLLAQARDQFTADDDPWGQAVIGFVRMETALKAGNQDLAIPTGRAAAAAFRELDDPWGLSAILYHLGWGLRQFGRYPEAARTLEEAIDVATSAGLYNTVQWALGDLGVTHLHQGHRDQASDMFSRASAASEHIGDGAGTVLATYGHALMAQTTGDWPAARRQFATARDGFQTLGTPVPQGLSLVGLARCDEADGNLDTARDGYQHVLDLSHQVGEPSLTATALEGLGRIAWANGEVDEARAFLAQAAEVRQSRSRPAPPHERRDLATLATSGVLPNEASSPSL